MGWVTPGQETDKASLEDEDDADSAFSIRSSGRRSWTSSDSPGIEASEVVGHQRETKAWSTYVLGRPLVGRQIQYLLNVLRWYDLLQKSTRPLSPPFPQSQPY